MGGYAMIVFEHKELGCDNGMAHVRPVGRKVKQEWAEALGLHE